MTRLCPACNSLTVAFPKVSDAKVRITRILTLPSIGWDTDAEKEVVAA
jgi:hypothetical protein